MLFEELFYVMLFEFFYVVREFSTCESNIIAKALEEVLNCGHTLSSLSGATLKKRSLRRASQRTLREILLRGCDTLSEKPCLWVPPLRAASQRPPPLRKPSILQLLKCTSLSPHPPRITPFENHTEKHDSESDATKR